MRKLTKEEYRKKIIQILDEFKEGKIMTAKVLTDQIAAIPIPEKEKTVICKQ